MSILQPPGRYTVALKIGDDTFTQPLEVIKDPNSSGTIADINAQTTMLQDVQSDMNATAETINQIELLRLQLEDLQDVVGNRDDAETIVAAADTLGQELLAVEEQLTQLRVTGTGQDQIRWPSRVVEQLSYLALSVAVGDFQPTAAEGEVHAILKDRMQRANAELSELLRTKVEAFNRMLRERNVPPLISRR